MVHPQLEHALKTLEKTERWEKMKTIEHKKTRRVGPLDNNKFCFYKSKVPNYFNDNPLITSLALMPIADTTFGRKK